MVRKQIAFHKRLLCTFVISTMLLAGCGKDVSESVESTQAESIVEEESKEVVSKEDNSVEASTESDIEEETPLHAYRQSDDGTWECDGYIYKYRLEITGRVPNSAYDTTYVFLSNIEDISFDRAWKAAGYSSNSDDYFSPEDAVCVGWERATESNINADYSLLNDSALKDKILADYEEAYGYWMWFAGSAPMDGDCLKEEEYGNYYAFDYPGITTMDEFKKFLRTRFTDEIIESKLEGDFFKEYDGRLYVLDAARGSDSSINHVDYEVYYDQGKDEGEIVALIYRQSFDKETYEPYLTGEVDVEYIQFTMEDDGAVFNTFPTIW